MEFKYIGRRESLPVLYVKGNHYDVGFDIGRTFASLFNSHISTNGALNSIYLPLYETNEGRKVYDAAFTTVKSRFPQYVRELEGMADGSQIPFYKLFLLHLDDILPNVVNSTTSNGTNGCSTICCNQKNEELLGHNEDAYKEILNNCFIVTATITENEVQEVFTSFCYAGYLPGYAMSYNQYGLVYSINIISAKRLVKGKTPRSFLTRALLSANNLGKVEEILKDRGCGAADAMSVNLTFLNQEGDRLFHNIEVGPAEKDLCESPLSILTSSPGENIFHCNKFLRLNIDQVGGPIVSSSSRRHETYSKFKQPNCLKDIRNILGDQSDNEFTIFRESGEKDYVKTVAVGLFNCKERTWSIYMDNPKSCEPLVVLPIILK